MIICFQAESLGELQALVQMVAQFGKAEVAALAAQAGGVDLRAQVRGRHLGQRSEAHLRIAGRRAQLDPFETHPGEVLQRAVEILADSLPYGPGLAPDGVAQRIGLQIAGSGETHRADGARLEKASPRNCIAFVHGEHHILAPASPQAGVETSTASIQEIKIYREAPIRMCDANARTGCKRGTRKQTSFWAYLAQQICVEIKLAGVTEWLVTK